MKRKKIFTMVVVCLLVLAFMAIPLTVSAADKKLTRKMILGGRLGDSWFVLSQALAYFVNKQSDWLRLSWYRGVVDWQSSWRHGASRQSAASR